MSISLYCNLDGRCIMLVTSMYRIWGILLGLLVCGSALAAECVDVAIPKSAIESHHGKWIELTPEQWEFLRGIYVMNPLTLPGLPYGDKAALAKVDGNADGLIFFIDGDMACTPMPVPATLLKMMDDVAASTINHEGKGM